MKQPRTTHVQVKQIQLKSAIQHDLREVYLDYFNNFLSVEKFAEYYGFSMDFAKALINENKRLESED